MSHPGVEPETDLQLLRARLLAGWEEVAPGWGRQADQMRAMSMPVSAWMIERLSLQPGERVLELAAGPGDTGFLAAELIRPGGVLISSDGAETMLEVARARAAALGIDNVEFRRLELEWLDLPPASVDALLCRWGLMLCVDPAAACREARRVLRPGGRFALAVWDAPERNPWATVPLDALLEQGLTVAPGPSGPGMFALASPERVVEILRAGGFLDVVVEPIEFETAYASLDEFLEHTLERSQVFAAAYNELEPGSKERAREAIDALTAPYRIAGSGLRLPARALGAAATA